MYTDLRRYVVRIVRRHSPAHGAFPVEVRASKVHGYGLFATRNVMAGEPLLPMDETPSVGDHDGKRSSHVQYAIRSRRPTSYLINDGAYPGDDVLFSLERYENASAVYGGRVNCIFESTFMADTMVIALKPIAKGQELFRWYGTDYWLIRRMLVSPLFDIWVHRSRMWVDNMNGHGWPVTPLLEEMLRQMKP